jgi:hypothetical protein
MVKASWFLARLIFRLWKWRRNVPPKRRLTFTGLHGVISQNIVLFNFSNILQFLITKDKGSYSAILTQLKFCDPRIYFLIYHCQYLNDILMYWLCPYLWLEQVQHECLSRSFWNDVMSYWKVVYLCRLNTKQAPMLKGDYVSQQHTQFRSFRLQKESLLLLVGVFTSLGQVSEILLRNSPQEFPSQSLQYIICIICPISCNFK